MGVGLLLGHFHDLLRKFPADAQRALRVIAPVVDVVEHMGEGNEGVRGPKGGIDGKSGGGQATGCCVAITIMRRYPLTGAQQKLISLDTDRVLSHKPALVSGRELQLECRHDLPSELVLNRENIGEIEIETDQACPPVLASIPYLIAGLSHAAFEHRADASALAISGTETGAFL